MGKNSVLCRTHEVHRNLLKIIEEHMPSDEKLFDLSELFKVFGDSTRMKILFILFETEVCTCDLAEVMKISSAAVSHQLKILQRAKLIKNRRDGKAVYYSLADDHVKTIISQGINHIEE